MGSISVWHWTGKSPVASIILKGEKPADLLVDAPPTTVLNLKTAKVLSLTVPDAAGSC